MTTTRRLLAALLVAVALAAASCGSIGPESLAFVEEEKRPGKTVIRLATHDSSGLAEAIALWEREHPTATVVVELRAFDDHHSTLLEPRSDTLTPDVVTYDITYGPQIRERAGLLVDLDRFGGGDHESDAVPWRWAQGLADDGTLVALPADVGGMAIAYRADLLGRQLSLLVEGAETWCDLLVAADVYSDRTNDAFLPEADDLFESIVNQSDRRFHDESGALIHESNPAVHHAWDTTMRALGRAPVFADPCPDDHDIARFSANLSAPSEEWEEGLRRGDFAAVFASARALTRIQNTVPETGGAWRLAPLPGGGGGNSGGTQLAVHRGSPNPALAYDLIAFLVEPTMQLRVFREHGHLPAAESTYVHPDVARYEQPFFGDSPIGEIYTASVRRHITAPTGPEARLIMREFRAGVTRVESGHQTPRDAWDEVLWRIDELLD